MNQVKNIGCGKSLAYFIVLFFLGSLLLEILGGVNSLISKIPWYGTVIISISFVYVIINWNKKK